MSNLNKEIILDSHKIIWHKDRIDAWLHGERIAPITIDCALTRVCSYKCIYCYGMLQENEGYNLIFSIPFGGRDGEGKV